ncbi:MAG: hypothetical protein R3E01_02365 [Pirellulaceae bacterium]
MNDDRLKIYLNDHLALLVAETELAERCQRSNAHGPLGLFLRQLASELQVEQDLLRHMLKCVGTSESLVKQGMAWLAEKAGRFKLNDALLEYSDLSRLVELETLCVAVGEREAFWQNLHAARAADARLSHINFARQQQQAQTHATILSEHRLEAATKAL